MKQLSAVKGKQFRMDEERLTLEKAALMFCTHWASVLGPRTLLAAGRSSLSMACPTLLNL